MATKNYSVGIGAKLLELELGTAVFKITCSTVFDRLVPLELFGVSVFRDDPRLSDQSQNTWSFHPLFQEFAAQSTKDLEKVCSVEGDPVGADYILKVFETVPSLVGSARTCYTLFVKLISRWLISKGYSEEAADRHARAAAQGILGQCVTQELTCGAPVALWKELAGTRTQPTEDAEVKVIFGQIAEQLA